MAQTSVNTVPLWNGSDNIFYWGVPDTATYGETITVTATTQLSSFAFEIGQCSSNVAYRGEVYAWDSSNARATGAAIAETAPTTLPASGSYQLVTFNTGGVTLNPGTYVIFATTSKDQVGAPSSQCRFGSVANTGYPGGSFVFINNGPNPGQWTTGTWTTNWSGGLDLAMQINFGPAAAVPAASPMTLAVLGIGLMLTFFLLQMRKAKV
jgi:hypothetical protein